MKTSETIDKIAPALLAAQKLIGAAKKDAENPFFKSKYADLGEVIQVCKEHLNVNGITVLQPVSNGDGDSTYVETILLHESGQFVASTMKVALKDKENPQAQGSAITYARRYSLQSMILIPAEDDDAQSAMPSDASMKPGGVFGKFKAEPTNSPETQVFPATTPVVDASLGLGPEHKKLFLLLGKAVERWQQPMGDILYRLSTFKTKNEKGEEITVKGKYVLKELKATRAAVCAEKLQRLLAKSESQEPPGLLDDDMAY